MRISRERGLNSAVHLREFGTQFDCTSPQVRDSIRLLITGTPAHGTQPGTAELECVK